MPTVAFKQAIYPSCYTTNSVEAMRNIYMADLSKSGIVLMAVSASKYPHFPGSILFSREGEW